MSKLDSRDFALCGDVFNRDSKLLGSAGKLITRLGIDSTT